MSTLFFADYTAFSAYLDELGLFRMTLGLERIEGILERLQLHRPPFTVVQVVGTNGKGSTSTMLASLARAHGLRVGLSTSPHFLTPRERVRIDGSLCSEEQWVALANTLMAHGGQDLSYFEFITALAMQAFAEAKVDVAVMETGLGGKWDATTALAASLVVFTPIDLDHQAVLGASLGAIAADKAGAIRPNVPVISHMQHPEAWAALELAAKEKQAPLQKVSADSPLPPLLTTDGYAMHLTGAHQLANARVALAAWNALAKGLLTPAAQKSIAAVLAATSPDVLQARALSCAWLPGRMQRVAAISAAAGMLPPASDASATEAPAGQFPSVLGWPSVILDGAHNVHGFSALGLALAREGIGPGAVIFSCLSDKEPEQLVALVRALATGPIFVPPIKENPRAMDPVVLAEMIGVNAVPVASFNEAILRAAEHLAERLPEVYAGATKNPLLICGSLYMLGEFYALRPDCLEGES